MSVQSRAELLAALWPALSEALERDAGAGDGQPAPSSVAPGLPVNLDVLRTLASLHRDIRAAARRAADQLGEQRAQRGVLAILAHVLRWHGRLIELGEQAAADQLDTELGRWVHLAKLSLGLRTPDRRLGQFCPAHDDPLVELVAPGDDAEFWPGSMVDGQWIGPVVRWTRHVQVLCRHCGEIWRPEQYLTLKRQLLAADTRRLTAMAEAAA